MTHVQRTISQVRSGLRSAVSVWVPTIRSQEQAEMLVDYVHRGDSVLDVGCGKGYLSKYLEEMYAAEPTGLDIKDIRVAPISLRIFDGTSIPFPDKAFDHVVLSFALHHSHAPMTLIQECRRVARRNIIVFEDLPATRFGKMVLFVHVRGAILARYYSLGPGRSADYRSALEWLRDKVINVVRVAMPPAWWYALIYPRILLVYALSDD